MFSKTLLNIRSIRIDGCLSSSNCRLLSTKASAMFQTKPYKLHKMDQGPSTDVTLTREDALKFYEEMATIRRLEAAANSLYKEKAIRGFCHLYTGQEAVCVGMENAITYGLLLLMLFLKIFLW